MDKKKMRVTFLWTDESVMQRDFAGKKSATMIEWANTFYDRFGFELDVEPSADKRKTVASASKYALKKRDGLRPDTRDPKEVTEEEDAHLAEIEKQIEALRKKKDDAIRRSVAAAQKAKALMDEQAQLLSVNTATLSTAQLIQLTARLDALRAQAAPLLVELNGLIAEEGRLQAAMDRIELTKTPFLLRSLEKLRKMNWDREFRVQMSTKYGLDGIGSEKRLNVVFCEFYSLLRMRRPRYVEEGVTPFEVLGFTLFKPLRLLLWPYRYVLLDIGGQRRNLAHEIVHAAGHSHPDARMVFQGVEKRISGVHFPTRWDPNRRAFEGTTYDYVDEDLYEEVPGGYYDGPKNDLMNYELRDPEPQDCVLQQVDRDRLERAFFVIP